MTKSFMNGIRDLQRNKACLDTGLLDLLLELLILQLVHSIRTGNFEQYIESLTNITPWMFAFDLICYAGWLSVHLRNLCQLVRKHPSNALNIGREQY